MYQMWVFCELSIVLINNSIVAFFELTMIQVQNLNFVESNISMTFLCFNFDSLDRIK